MDFQGLLNQEKVLKHFRKRNIWSGTPFEWLRDLRPGNGMICERIYFECKKQQGHAVDHYGPGAEIDGIIDDATIEVKTASQNKDGSKVFLFNQLNRIENLDIYVLIFCFPDDIRIFETAAYELYSHYIPIQPTNSNQQNCSINFDLFYEKFAATEYTDSCFLQPWEHFFKT